MRYKRRFPSCVGIGRKIYIIGGGYISIDVYDIASISYHDDIYQLDHRYAVAKFYDDRVHLISRNTYIKYSTMI